MSGDLTPRHETRAASRGMPTRILLICGALGGIQALISLATAPFTPVIAAAAPPAYALVAGVHSVLPFLSRRLTGVPWTATLTAGTAGILMWPLSSIGPLVLIPFLVGAASFDAVLARPGSPTRRHYAMAAIVAAVALFLVSLSVFSPAHLVPSVLIGTLVGRLAGEAAAAYAATMVGRGLNRAGFTFRPPNDDRPTRPDREPD